MSAHPPKCIAGHSQHRGYRYMYPMLEVTKPSVPLILSWKKMDGTPGSQVSFCFPLKTNVSLLRSKIYSRVLAFGGNVTRAGAARSSQPLISPGPRSGCSITLHNPSPGGGWKQTSGSIPFSRKPQYSSELRSVKRIDVLVNKQ